MTRSDAAMRALLAIPFLLIYYIVSAIGFMLVLIYTVLDLLYALVTGNDMVGTEYVIRYIDWLAVNSKYFATGKGDPMWFP